MKEIEKPLKSNNMAENVEKWDAEFIDLDDTELFKIVNAANYLMIQSLLDLSCAKIASYIKGKSTQEIRDRFNIVNDFTEEEEEKVVFLHVISHLQIRQENRWADDL